MSRRRSFLISVALVALSLGAMTGSTVAAGSPEGAVDTLLDAIVAQDPDAMGASVCEARRDEVLVAFDLRTALSSGDVDAGPVVDAMTFRIEDRAVSVVSEAGDAASVAVVGRLRMDVDPAAARAWVRQSLEATGQPTDDATVDEYLDFFVASMSEGTDLAGTVEVVRADGDWLVCDTLADDLADESPAPGATLLPPVAPLCDTMTIEELNAATGLAFVSTSPYDHGCTWDSDFTDEYYNVSVFLEDGDLEFIRSVWTGGKDVTIGGRDAWATPNGTWVDVGGGLLTIIPYLEGAPSTQGTDPVELARIVGELVVPRLP